MNQVIKSQLPHDTAIANVKHFVPKVSNKDVSIMKIANILGIFALVFGICSGQEDPKKTEELLDLFDKIGPGMKDQLLVLREFLKAFKVLNRKPQNNLYAYRKQQRITGPTGFFRENVPNND